MSLALLVILAAVASGLDDVRPRVGKQFRDEERKKYDIELTFPVDGDDATNRRTEGLNREIQKLLEQIVLEGDSLTVDKNLPGTKLDPGSIIFDTSYECSDGEVVIDDQCVPCPHGTYFDQSTSTCLKCPVGQYNSEPAQRACTSCPTDADGNQKVTPGLGSIKESDCVPRCKPGMYYDDLQPQNEGLCRNCDFGTYQEDEGKFKCEQCPLGLTTRSRASTSREECVPECDDGEQLNTLGSCDVCQAGTFRKKGVHRTCQECPARNGRDYTTERDGSTSEADCVKIRCHAGEYLTNTSDGQYLCEQCPTGRYQPQEDQTECIACPPDTSTQSKGARSIDKCINRCNEGGGDALCDRNARCFFNPEKDFNDFTCECKLGYNGTNAEARKQGGCKNVCEGLCRNEGTCILPKSKKDPPYCQCVGSFTGRQCEEKSNFAYMAGGIAGAVIFVIILVLLIWMICVRATKSKKPNEKIMHASGDANGSQVNFYYGAPAPYAESIAPSQHGSTYAHYYEDEEEGWGMPNFYDTYGKNSKMARSNGSLYNAGAMYGPGVYGPQYAPQGELYDRLGRHAYHPRPEDKSGNDTTSESDDDGSRRQ